MTAAASILAPLRRSRPLARAFTLMELLVVIAIFVIVLAIAVPSFAALLRSQERSQAENQLAVAMSAARSTAIATEGLGDAVAVFLYEPGGRTKIVIHQQVGQINDLDSAGIIVKRDVFVAATGVPPIVLPRGWMVRAFAPPGAIDGWYEANTYRMYSTSTGNWVFPESGFYDPDRKVASNLYRQSFMVRFEAGTGLVNMSSRVPAIVVDPSPSSLFRQSNPWGRFPSLLRADDPANFIKRILATRRDVNDADRRLMFGDRSPDTVLCRPVTELALYDERALAAGIGARAVNSVTGCLYGDAKSPTAVPTIPSLDPRLFGGVIDAPKVTEAINDWIQGTSDTGFSDAQIFTIDRYQGTAREVKP